MNPFVCLEDAKKDFEKKFREKTKNKWEEREHFVAHPNKYTLIEVQGEAETQEAVMKVTGVGQWGKREGTACPPACLAVYTQILASFSDLNLGLYKCPALPPGVSILPSCSCPHRLSLCRWTEAQ